MSSGKGKLDSELVDLKVLLQGWQTGQVHVDGQGAEGAEAAEKKYTAPWMKVFCHRFDSARNRR